MAGLGMRDHLHDFAPDLLGDCLEFLRVTRFFHRPFSNLAVPGGGMSNLLVSSAASSSGEVNKMACMPAASAPWTLAGRSSRKSVSFAATPRPRRQCSYISSAGFEVRSSQENVR